MKKDKKDKKNKKDKAEKPVAVIEPEKPKAPPPPERGNRRYRTIDIDGAWVCWKFECENPVMQMISHFMGTNIWWKCCREHIEGPPRK